MIYDNIIQTIGKTPVVKLNSLKQAGIAEIYAKLEFFNPGGSVKDRIAANMILEMQKDGALKNGDIIVEPTSGNTGIGIAMTASALGYEVVLTMPETMSIERRKILAAYGAKLVLTDGVKGMKGAIEKANELAKQPGYVMLSQFENAYNPQAHVKTTAVEIMSDFKYLDAFVAGVGTGGTLSGVAKVLKENGYDTQIVAVEPKESAVISGNPAGAHKIQGIGAGFIPDTLDTSLIDTIELVSNEEAFEAARALAKSEGILLGISGGAALAVAIRTAKRLGDGKKVLFIAPDNGERYLSTPLYEA
ncbi:cysteine synthase A [Campylobacter sp. CCUG 57310]|uniref:cysteine synthase A n=1 Tax=Campylobacter sp. CCUG 57310 TaxID=2517362 RepID=UPI0015654E0A|nr:cysteine synthase A [Campylobacter sp. CCUG 57310]QKF91941.1 cysteine synthase [Campylobacter sp. CCUG 57310]